MAVEAKTLVVFVTDRETGRTLEEYAEDLLYPISGSSALYGSTHPSITAVRALLVPEWGMILAATDLGSRS